ncbi:aldose 1-epimerase [Spirillospora sp. NBC_00431]
MLEITNGRTVVAVAPERGAEIRSITLDGGPNALAYHDWTTPSPATAANGYGDSETDWLSFYRGGWQETIPNAGAECRVAGVPLAFHGESSVLEWDVVRAAAGGCELQVGLRLPLTVTRRMTLDPERPVLRVETTLTNESPLAVPYVWGHHPCFPAMDGTWVEIPAVSYATEPREAGDIATREGAWPMAETVGGAAADLSRAPDAETMRCFYLHGHDAGWAVVHQPDGAPSVALSWDVEAYPVTWLWQINGDPGFPWYARMRAVAVEPQTAWPYDGLAGAIERGQARLLEPGETASSWITVSVLDARPGGPVASVAPDGRVHERP